LRGHQKLLSVLCKLPPCFSSSRTTCMWPRKAAISKVFSH
jgi:hypothetical protein